MLFLTVQAVAAARQIPDPGEAAESPTSVSVDPSVEVADQWDRVQKLVGGEVSEFTT